MGGAAAPGCLPRVVLARRLPVWEHAGATSTVELADASVPWLGHARSAMVDFGTPVGRSFLVSGWGREEELDDGTTFVWSDGDVSVLHFDVPTPRTRRLTARVWP